MRGIRILLTLTILLVFVLPVFGIGEQIDLIDDFLLEDAAEEIAEGNYAAALELYDEFIDLNPDYPDAYGLRAQLLLFLEEEDAAFADLEIALEIAASDPSKLAQIYVLGAELYLRINELDTALVYYDLAIESDAEYSVAYENRAIVQNFLGDHEAALNDYETALALDPENPALYLAIAEIYTDLDEPQKAVDILTEGIDKELPAADLFILRGHNWGRLEEMLLQAEDYLAWISGIEVESYTADVFEDAEREDFEFAFGTNYRILFFAQEGERISVRANSAEVDPIIVILDTAGQSVIADDDSGVGLNAYIEEYIVPEDGEYTLVIGHARGGWDGTMRVLFERRSASDL